MAVPNSGQLKIWKDIWNDEIGGSQGDNSLHSASVYAGFSTPDAMSDFYGWSDVEAPSVSTSSASSVTQSSMTINGNVSNTGGENVTRGFYFGTSTNYASNTKYTLSGTQGTGAFSRSMTGLSAGTTYRINAWASNGAGETVGAQVSQATYVNFSPSFLFNRTLYAFGFTQSPGSGGTAYAQYQDPNTGYRTTSSGAVNSAQRSHTRPQYNNTTARGYVSISFPSGTCPSATCGNAWQTVVCSYGNQGTSANGGGAQRTGGHGLQPFSQGGNIGGACIGGQYYVVHPVHWADRIYNAHGVHYETASDIRFKTNVIYL